ncbi:hypothetical protein B0T20DRAFT_477504 [Sordaria brevicollis]|uniref:Uncharacterized protein n=1 Tax=Sordaria brevicollis TaxID=83679 RepID=A0AAE0PGT2_SORBR|nr:hypothetical protein B0T20DRAFT_477504 [Sordaria brevicollis]
MEGEVRRGNLTLEYMWEVITYLHKDLLYPSSRVVRPFEELSRGIPHQLEIFAAIGPPHSIYSITDVWASEEDIKRLSQRAPEESATRDIPRTYEQMLPYVAQMKLAITDMSAKLDMAGSEKVTYVRIAFG